MSNATNGPSFVRETVAVYRGPRLKTAARFASSRDVSAFLRKIVDDEPQEVFIVVLVDVKLRPIGYTQVSRGTLSGALVDASMVFRTAIVAGAYGVFLAHTHPSGDPTPSAEDDALTERMRQAGTLLGIDVLDHIVLGDGSYVSYRDTDRFEAD